MKLLKKTAVGQRRVYDIEVEDVHNFFANGVNVHNCATDGGVSVIKDDGTVVDSAGTLTMGTVNFDDDNGLWYSRNVASHLLWYSTSSDYQAGDGFGDVVADDYNNNYSFPLLTRTNRVAVASEIYIGGSSGDTGFVKNGLMLHQPNYTNQAEGMSALTTSSYATGWMPGDIKMAALADTTAETFGDAVSGATVSDPNGDGVYDGEHITNGEFTTDTSGWTAENGAVLSVVSGNLRVTNGIAADGRAIQAIPTVVGQMYEARAQVTAAGTSNWGQLRISNNPLGFSPYASSPTGIGNKVVYFTATEATTYVVLSTATATITSVDFDNISVKLADADRSVNNNGLAVHGSITKTPVATGADVVAYSGFSSSNYLEQPYNPDLDFGAYNPAVEGSGDFCVMAWVKTSSSAKMAIAARYDRTNTNADFYLNKMNTNTLAFEVNGAIVAQSTSLINDGAWHYAVAVRKSGLVKLYLDGSQVASAANTSDLDNASGILGVGVVPVTTPVLPFDGSIALLRISATAPTADQIRKIYEDERPLFQENAKATLTGNSDAVTALAHDPDTDLLHVGTSGGRSVFQGLRRVEEHTDTDNQSLAAISAVDGLVVEGK
jgi:hypothetical protein